MAFVDRLIAWQQAEGPEELRVQGGFVGPAYNFDPETFADVSRWHEKTTGHRLTWIPLGGIKILSEPDMRSWLRARQSVGVEGISASFVGYGEVHDRWQGRRGDFEFLMRTLRAAAELGMEHGTTLYLTKSSLPLLDELARMLDTLPTPHAGRHLRPFYYVGHAPHHEAERLTEDDRQKLPLFVTQNLREWVLHSEREWIEIILDETEAPENLFLHLELTPENIDRLEQTECHEIFSDLDHRARATLSALPGIHELAKHYSDRNGTKIYMFKGDLQRMWLQRFLDANSIEFDQSLLHYHLGRSANPPTLWD